MSLNLFRIDLSQLSPIEKNDLIKRIGDNSYMGPDLVHGTNYAEFFLEKRFDVNTLNIPDKCNLTHLS